MFRVLVTSHLLLVKGQLPHQSSETCQVLLHFPNAILTEHLLGYQNYTYAANLRNQSHCKSLLQQWVTTSHLLEWPKSKILTIPKDDEDVEQKELPFIASESGKWWRHFGRLFGCSLKTLNKLWYNPAIMFLSIYPRELKMYVHTKTCTHMFIATLLIIAKIWNCPSIGEWINYGT